MRHVCWSAVLVLVAWSAQGQQQFSIYDDLWAAASLAQRCPGGGWVFGPVPAPGRCLSFAGSGPCCHRGTRCTSECEESPSPAPAPTPPATPPSPTLEAVAAKAEEALGVAWSVSFALSASAAPCGAANPDPAAVARVLSYLDVPESLEPVAAVALTRLWRTARCLTPRAAAAPCDAPTPPAAALRAYAIAVSRRAAGAAGESLVGELLGQIDDADLIRLFEGSRWAARGCEL